MFQASMGEANALLQQQLAAAAAVAGHQHGGQQQGFTSEALASLQQALNVTGPTLIQPVAAPDPNTFNKNNAAQLHQLGPADVAGGNNSQVTDFIGWLANAYNAGGQGNGANPLAVSGALPFVGNGNAGEVNSQNRVAAAAAVPAVATGASTQLPAAGLINNVSAPARTASQTGHQNEDVQSLLGKVQRRLQQNRESARKCRQRKKEYMRQLEEELAAMQARQKAAATAKRAAANTEAADNTPSESGAATMPASAGLPVAASRQSSLAVEECPALAALSAWHVEYDTAIAELSVHLRVNADDAAVSALLERCLSLLPRQSELTKDLIKADMFAVLSGHHMLPEERLVLWMGGARPSELLQLVSGELSRRGMLPTGGPAESMERLRESWSHQEDTLQHGFAQLRSSISELLMAPDDAADGSPCAALNPRMLGKLDAMRMMLQRAEAFRGEYHLRLRNVLPSRSFAWALTVPMLLKQRLQRLRAVSAEV